MNILIFNWRDIKNPERGGAEIILYELAKRLVKRGHGVEWFSQKFAGGVQEEVLDGIKIIRRGNKYSVFFRAFLYYQSLSTKPDLVLDCVNTICWQTPLYVEKKRRILYANQSAREVLFYKYPPLLSLLAYLLEPLQFLSYKSTKTICYSQSIKDDLVSFDIPANNIDTFPLGIDHQRYQPGKKFVKPTFIFVSRFVKYKKADLCIVAMKTVVKTDPRARLYLVGYGEEENNLKRLINKLRLGENVFIVNKNNLFLEKNLKDVKVKLMQGAWALLLSSVKEGWGMVVTEAAACGTPSIVSNVTGLKDSVVANKTGVILSKNPKPPELALAMTRLIMDQTLRKKLSQEAVLWSKNFSWEKSFKSFYEKLTQN